MSRIVTLAAGLLVATSATAFAHSNDARQEEQAALIESGRQDGSITWREGLKLRKEQREIDRVEAEFREDGNLTRHERRLLHEMQDEAEEHIASEASDGWHRLWFLPRVGK